MSAILTILIWAFCIVLIVWAAQFIVGIFFYAIGMLMAFIIMVVQTVYNFVKRGLGL